MYLIIGFAIIVGLIVVGTLIPPDGIVRVNWLEPPGEDP
jgi:hypothetical protein